GPGTGRAARGDAAPRTLVPARHCEEFDCDQTDEHHADQEGPGPMTHTRYCRTCGSLLGEGAAICGEGGACYRASRYVRRATETAVAWSPPPTPRSRDLGPEDEEQDEEEAVQLISRDSLAPEKPGATTLRPREQYDQVMVTQPPMPQNAPGASAGMPSGPGSPVTA